MRIMGKINKTLKALWWIARKPVLLNRVLSDEDSWHDYGFHPEQVRFEVMAAILDAFGPERTGKVYHVAHTKCAIFTGKSYPCKPAEFPMIPEEYYTFDLTRNKITVPR